MPKTAISMPTVKKRVRQYSSQFFNIEALTTALSNERETSITAKIKASQTMLKAKAIPPLLYPHQPAHAKATTEKIKENLK